MNNTRPITPSQFIHNIASDKIKVGSICIDATCGKGFDTLFLAERCGASGKVYAFDIQAQAITIAEKRVAEAGYKESVQFILDGHENMGQYIEDETADVIMFNLGYLPGGDHNIATNAKSTIEALKTACRVLKKDGMITLCIYSGGDTGFEEREAVLEYLKTLPQEQYHVDIRPFDRPNNPPLPVFIVKK